MGVVRSLNFLKSEKPDIQKIFDGKMQEFDTVEGPMADDTIWNFVNDYLEGNISKEVFFEYAKFKHPTHQISFHSIRALDCLKFVKGESLCSKK